MWGHATSRDLMNWEYVGAPLLPDEPFDCHGVYSGSALAEDGCIRVLYTGNVKLSDADGTYDYVNTGRRADTVYVESVDGLAGREFSQKRVVLASDDYPEDLTCHVRDPKVWRDDDGRYHMVLGARRRVDGPHVDSRFCAMHGEGAGRDVGEILVYGSADMLSWERPGYLELEPDGGVPAKWLSFSPQGLEGGRWDRGNVYAAGYMPVTGDITGGNDAYELGEFRLWDAGFDFYAPQSFEDAAGRRLMIGWSGCPDATAKSPTVARGWQCALTVPRELSMRDGKLCQQPAHEIERMRGDCVRATGGETVEEPGRLFDLVVSCEGAKMVELEIRKGVFVRYTDGMLTLDMGDEGYGRDQRSIELGELRDLRVLSDTTMVEIFANGGEAALTSRTYSPAVPAMELHAEGAASMNFYRLVH